MLIKNPGFTKAPEVKEICDTYFGHLGLNLNYFGTGLTFKDGRYDFLLSKIDWGINHIIDNDFPPAGYINFDKIENSIILPHLHADSDMGWTEGAIRNASERFGIRNLMLIFRKYDDHIQAFFFDLHEPNAHEIFVNHFDIFENFIFYFKDKAQDLIKLTSKNRAMVSDKNKKKEGALLTRQNNTLFPTQYFLRRNGRDSAISPREYECLKLLAHGAKFKEVSNTLNISSRTVDTYVGNLKKKLDVFSLSEAIKVYWQNRITEQAPHA